MNTAPRLVLKKQITIITLVGVPYRKSNYDILIETIACNTPLP